MTFQRTLRFRVRHLVEGHGAGNGRILQPHLQAKKQLAFGYLCFEGVAAEEFGGEELTLPLSAQLLSETLAAFDGAELPPLHVGGGECLPQAGDNNNNCSLYQVTPTITGWTQLDYKLTQA